MTDKTKQIGDFGESVAARFLENNGYFIKESNFQRRYGEIDLVAKKEELVFAEVKTVRCRIPDELPREGSNTYRPEENVGEEKRRRLRRITEVYLSKHDVELPWRCDLLCVYLDIDQRAARVKWLRNIII